MLGGYVSVRESPNTSARVLRQPKGGTYVGINCWTTGSWVSGTSGSTNIWDALDGGGWANDGYLPTGSNSAVTSRCTAGSALMRGGGDVNIRQDPNTSRAQLRTIRNKAVVALGCWTSGQKMVGGYSPSSVWYRVIGGGWISDAFTETGTNTGTVTSKCGGAPLSPGVWEREHKAYDWAMSQRGVTKFADGTPVAGWCGRWSALAYGRSASGYYTALAQFNAYKSRGMIKQGTPPRGTLVFFVATKANGYMGHEAIATVDGRVIKVPEYTWQGVTVLPYSSIGAPFVGWVYAEPGWTR